MAPNAPTKLKAHRVETYETVFLLGSGVNTNPWVPVVSAIQKVAPHLGSMTGEHINYWLSMWIFHMRVGALVSRRRKASPIIRNSYKSEKGTDRYLRESIADKLRLATNHPEFFGIRPEFQRVLEEPHWRNFTFLTTNWDRNLAEQDDPASEGAVETKASSGETSGKH